MDPAHSEMSLFVKKSYIEKNRKRNRESAPYLYIPQWMQQLALDKAEARHQEHQL